MTATLPLKQFLSAQALDQIDSWIAKYPVEQKCAAVMAALRIAQDEQGYLSQDLMIAVADYLQMPPISVFEVATFYSMYDLKPVGKHKICVCTNISCLLCGSEKIVAHLEKRLNIRLGQTTADNLITLKEVECLGACCGAPMMQIGHAFYERLTPEKIDAILAQLRQHTGEEKIIAKAAS